MFTTSFSYEILVVFQGIRPILLDLEERTEPKFDIILSYTLAIHKYNDWMHDHEQDDWTGGEMLRILGSMWNELMQMSPIELGIDAEFTLPALKTFLREFEKEIKDVGEEIEDPTMKFNWDSK